MSTFTFTEKRIKDLPKPEANKRVRYQDDECPGLIVRVTTGAKVFAYRIRSVEVTIGKWPALSVEQARADVRAKIAPDPKAARDKKRNQREALSLADCWEALLASPTRKRDGAPLRATTLRSYVIAWDHLRPHLGTRQLVEVTGEMVTDTRTKLLKEHGPAQTRRALSLLVVLMGGRMPRDTNGRAVQKPSIAPRSRFMSPVELGALLRGLDAEPHLWRVFWMTCLLAPLRRGNIANARWSDLNLDHPARWTVSADDAKGRKLLAMPIIEPLVRILRDWKTKNPASEWVFPAGQTAGPRAGNSHITSVQHAWARALLLGEAVRLCDAIATLEGVTTKERFTLFLGDVEHLRWNSWKTARDRKPMERLGTPLARAVGNLRAVATKLKIDVVQLELRNLTPHDLRRTAASWAVQSGASLQVVSASLGHSDTRTTEAHYGHLADDPIRQMLTNNASRLLATINLENVGVNP